MRSHNPKERPKIELLSSLLPQTKQKDHVLSCLVEDMKRTISKLINSDNVREAGWETSENPFPLLTSEAPQKYSSHNPESPEGRFILRMHFISQSAPDSRCKL